MKKDEGFILLKSLLTMAVVLICIAAFFTVLAVAARQSGFLQNRVGEDLNFRKEKIMERIK